MKIGNLIGHRPTLTDTDVIFFLVDLTREKLVALRADSEHKIIML